MAGVLLKQSPLNSVGRFAFLFWSASIINPVSPVDPEHFNGHGDLKQQDKHIKTGVKKCYSPYNCDL